MAFRPLSSPLPVQTGHQLPHPGLDEAGVEDMLLHGFRQGLHDGILAALQHTGAGQEAVVGEDHVQGDGVGEAADEAGLQHQPQPGGRAEGHGQQQADERGAHRPVAQVAARFQSLDRSI